MKTYVIHMTRATERADLVKRIQDLTGAQHFEAIVATDGNVGCRNSHFAIYRSVPDGEDLMIFEDDCEILDPSFLQMVEREKANYDVIFIGITRYCEPQHIPHGANWKDYSYGTHAMWISSKAMKCILEYETTTTGIDLIWNEVINKYNLKAYRPSHPERYVRQKLNLVSYITGRIRTQRDRRIDGLSRSVLGSIVWRLQ